MIPEAEILLIGATAFIGRHVSNQISRSGTNLVATTRSPIDDDDPMRRLKNVNVIHLDLSDSVSFKHLPKRVSTIIHIAAASSESSASDIIKTNVHGMQNLLDYALVAGADRFIFTSSISVHGEINVDPIDSNTPIVNPNTYGLSKLAGEMLLHEKASVLSSFAIRLPSVLGIGAKNHWLAKVRERALKHQDITIFNPENRFNNAVDVNALSNFILHLANSSFRGSHVFPIASSGFITIENAVKRIITRTGSSSKVKTRLLDKSSFTINFSSARKLGFNPTGIEDALDAFCE